MTASTCPRSSRGKRSDEPKSGSRASRFLHLDHRSHVFFNPEELIPIPTPDAISKPELQLLRIDRPEDLPDWAPRDLLARFFHETMAPWNDTLEDVQRALDYLFSDAEGKGGFLVLASQDDELVGALAMLNTGMGGYVPAHILLFVSVDPGRRGQGLGRRIIEYALAECDGPVKLHVEYDNPAKRLYERVGFSSKYAEMRYTPPTSER